MNEEEYRNLLEMFRDKEPDKINDINKNVLQISKMKYHVGKIFYTIEPILLMTAFMSHILLYQYNNISIKLVQLILLTYVVKRVFHRV